MADIGKVTPGSRIIPRVPQEQQPDKGRSDEQREKPQEGPAQEQRAPMSEEHEGENKHGGIDVFV